MIKAATTESTHLQASSNKAHFEDGPYELLFEHGGNTESETDTARRGKKRKVTKKDGGGRETTIKKVKGVRGMLRDVKKMPLDILFELFSLLNPMDLVNLARTSKDLRAIITSRSSISVWKSARANVFPTMPDCPDDLSEPQYAELAFGKGCHYCQRILGTIRTLWLLRKRICNKCVDTHCSIGLPYQDMEPIYVLQEHVPRVEVFSGRSTRPRTYYFLEFAKLWLDTYNNVTDHQEKESWKIAKVEERKAINNHALLCATWVEECFEYQQFLVDQLIRKRKDDITKHVAYLGWGDEVLKMLPHEQKFEDQLLVQKICQKELTGRIFLSLNTQINEFMEAVKQGRLKREKEASFKDRLPILQKVHNDHLLTFPTAKRYWYPMASELFLREPEIRDIVNDASSTLESMKEQLVLSLPKIYPNSISKLIRRIDDQLLEVIAASRPGQVIDRETVFGLATTVFECSDCNRYNKRILRYSEAVLHSCTRNFDFPKECEDREYIAKYLEGKYRSHWSGRLTPSKTALKLVPILLKLCGFDLWTTTAQMMDDLDPIFECIPCGSPGKGRATMTWLGVVVHFDRVNHASNIEGMVLERLNEDEENVARKRIIESQERARASTAPNNPLIQCAHCFKNGSGKSRAIFKRHMKLEHGIEGSTEKHLMLNVDADHIPNTFYMWPPRKLEEDE